MVSSPQDGALNSRHHAGVASCTPGCGDQFTPPKRHIASAFLTMQGIANLVGVTWLGSLLRDASIKAALASSSLGFVAGAMPFLQVRRRMLGCRALV